MALVGRAIPFKAFAKNTNEKNPIVDPNFEETGSRKVLKKEKTEGKVPKEGMQ